MFEEGVVPRLVLEDVLDIDNEETVSGKLMLVEMTLLAIVEEDVTEEGTLFIDHDEVADWGTLPLLLLCVDEELAAVDIIVVSEVLEVLNTVFEELDELGLLLRENDELERYPTLLLEENDEEVVSIVLEVDAGEVKLLLELEETKLKF